MYIVFSTLCEKDVINCTDGSVLGSVSDIEISTDDCKITAITVKPQTGLFCKADDIRIPCDKIEKIGVDVIIVNYCPPQVTEKCCEKPRRFSFK